MMQVTRALCAVSLALITLIPSFAFAQVATTTNITATTTASTSLASSGQAIDSHNQADVSRAVAHYFSDIPVMYAIAKCESDFTQYDAGGAPLDGGSGGMIGVFQINKSVHAKFALTLGDDITTLGGNMAYAKYLYNESGTEPWDSSKSCWSAINAASAVAAILGTAANAVVSALVPTTASASTSNSTPAVSTGDVSKSSVQAAALSINLKLGSVSAQVLTLQKLLNSKGYKIAKAGPGSPGQETSKFGSLTKAAVERFQCANNIVCKGTELTTGYGYVGAKTRAALLVNS